MAVNILGLNEFLAVLLFQLPINIIGGMLYSMYSRKKEGFGAEAQKTEAFKDAAFTLSTIGFTFLGGSNILGQTGVYQICRKLVSQIVSGFIDYLFPKLVLRRKIAGNIYFLIPFNRKKFSSTGIVISAAKIASDLEIDLGYEMGTIRAMHLKRYGKDLYKEEDLNQMLYAIKRNFMPSSDTTSVNGLRKIRAFFLEQMKQTNIPLEISTISETAMQDLIEQRRPREVSLLVERHLDIYNRILEKKNSPFRMMLAFASLFSERKTMQTKWWKQNLPASGFCKEEMKIWVLDRNLLPVEAQEMYSNRHIVVDHLARHYYPDIPEADSSL